MADGSGLPMPRRRTFATDILSFAHSMLTALRHPACACQQRRLSGHGQPLTDASNRMTAKHQPTEGGFPGHRSERQAPRRITCTIIPDAVAEPPCERSVFGEPDRANQCGPL